MSKISQIQVDRTTYNVCDLPLRDRIDWLSKHQWNVYETDDGTNFTTRALPAKTMNSSNHPYTEYQNYAIFEERTYDLTETPNYLYSVLLCNSVQFLSGNSTSGSANALASAVFRGMDNGDTFIATASPDRYQLQYVSSGLMQRDHWTHFEQLSYGGHYCYRYGMMSSTAKSITDTATNCIQIKGWVLTRGIVTIGDYGYVFYGESSDDHYCTKTITISS